MTMCKPHPGRRRRVVPPFGTFDPCGDRNGGPDSSGNSASSKQETSLMIQFPSAETDAGRTVAIVAGDNRGVTSARRFVSRAQEFPCPGQLAEDYCGPNRTQGWASTFRAG